MSVYAPFSKPRNSQNYFQLNEIYLTNNSKRHAFELSWSFGSKLNEFYFKHVFRLKTFIVMIWNWVNILKNFPWQAIIFVRMDETDLKHSKINKFEILRAILVVESVQTSAISIIQF